eukprot:TRINITY_DN1787_c0_g3_i2.p1 TRINITY_DN1787_c0_g3~~TRINITY_DN1787_c0_g3_i2.p1  ORF type:complete len:408 (-),score=93.85 TRINITY_DN1787_c0_g3_i2:103-1326(-)
MASLKSEIEFLREELSQLNAKLEDVSEKIDAELSKSENLRNQALLDRQLSKEERLLAEKDKLIQVRGRLLLSLADGREERLAVDERRSSDDEKALKQKEEEAEEEERETKQEQREEEQRKEEDMEELEKEKEEEKKEEEGKEEEKETSVELEEGVHGAQLAVRDTCHSHTLLREVLSGDRTCDICHGSMTFPGTAFNCKPCNFDAHGSCLTADLRLPPTLTDARHPHALTLLPKTRTGDLSGRYECSECREVGRTWVYECGTDTCGYKMHPDCVRVQIQAHVGFGHWMTLSYADPKAACSVPSCPHPSRGGDPAVFKCCLDEWKSSTCDVLVHPACIENKTSPYDETKARETDLAVKEGREKMKASIKAAQEAAYREELREIEQLEKLTASMLRDAHNITFAQRLYW